MPIPARSAADAAAEHAAFVRYLRTGRRTPSLEYKFNPYHDAETGQFTTAEGAGGAADNFEEAQLSPAIVARGAAMAIDAPADGAALLIQNIVGAPSAPGMLPGTEQRDLNAKVRDILKTRRASIRNKGLDPGSPSWDEINDLTLKDVLARYKRDQKSTRQSGSFLQMGDFQSESPNAV